MAHDTLMKSHVLFMALDCNTIHSSAYVT